jgi:hypothetical protein
VLVADDGPDGHPVHSAGLAYTVGLTHTYEHPELVLTGPWEQAHAILAGAVDLVEAGTWLGPDDESDEIVDGYPVRFAPVGAARAAQLLTYAGWLYGGAPFAALQLLLPDAAGRFPDERRYDGYPQPLLG